MPGGNFFAFFISSSSLATLPTFGETRISDKWCYLKLVSSKSVTFLIFDFCATFPGSFGVRMVNNCCCPQDIGERVERGFYHFLIIRSGYCGHFLPIENGKILHPSYRLSGRYVTGDKAYFRCDYPRVRRGPSSDTCQLTGRWDPGHSAKTIAICL